MPSFRPTEPWPADPHTLAKIELVSRYVGKWISIVGRYFKGKQILFIEGFAGPGIYKDGERGSPIASIQAVSKSMSIAKNSNAWRAGDVYVELVERERKIFESLQHQVESVAMPHDIHVTMRNGSFDKEFQDIRNANPWAFRNGYPLFAFVDPFGAKGAPFSLIRELLGSGTSEVLLNLDADGITRIESYRTASNIKLLNKIFGDVKWINDIDPSKPFKERCRMILSAYRTRLHQIPGVKYSFPFEMQQSPGLPDYFLLFATKHQRGIEKMKETMKSIGQDGSLRFCDAWNGQTSLFREDDPNVWATKLHAQFKDQGLVPWQDIVDFTLNETPFENPKAMLRVLDSASKLDVTSSNPNRRRCTFPDKTIQSIRFI